MPIDDLSGAARELATVLDQCEGSLLVVTGAGVSLASGIPTFRGTDPGAIWKHDLTELATFGFFQSDPVASWRFYLDRFDLVRDARPNPAHLAIAALDRVRGERDREFLLVTQNVDTLHEAAGTTRMIKVHGSVDRVRCSAPGCRLGAPRGSLRFGRADAAAFMGDPSFDTLPRCPECEAPLRPHVLWFDEFYGDHVDYHWDRLLLEAAIATTIVFIGTSFSVGVTDVILQSGIASGATMVSIDPGAHRQPVRALRHLQVPAEEVLPAACRELGVEIETDQHPS